MSAQPGEGQAVYVLTDGRRRNMRAIRRRDTKPEVALRKLLHAAGLRFRTDLRIDLGAVKPRPDIVFTRRKVAIFVDGCFWHSCPEHGRPPSANSAYWSPKLAGNRERDHRYDEALGRAGWLVVRVWEHEPAEDTATRVAAAVQSRV